MKHFVVIEEGEDSIFCLGVFDNYHSAVGATMESIWEFSESYQDEGDEFWYSKTPYRLEGDAGQGIEVAYKCHAWETTHKSHYFILESFDGLNAIEGRKVE